MTIFCESETYDSIIDSTDESNMNMEFTDDSVSATNFEKSMKRKHTMRLIDVKSDGNCFCHAVAHQLCMYNENDNFITHSELRSFATGYMNDNKTFFEDYFSEYDDNIDNDINKMSQSNRWVDNYVIQALCNSFKFDINIYPDTAYNLPIRTTTDKNFINQVAINIAYINQNHYVSLQNC